MIEKEIDDAPHVSDQRARYCALLEDQVLCREAFSLLFELLIESKSEILAIFVHSTFLHLIQQSNNPAQFTDIVGAFFFVTFILD